MEATRSRWCVASGLVRRCEPPSRTTTFFLLFKLQYMTAFKARVTNYNTKTLYPAPRLARKCVGAPNICVPGPKQPHFWMQNEKNNAPNPDFDPPYVRLLFFGVRRSAVCC